VGRWGEEFTAATPDEIRQLQERAAGANCVPRREAIRGRVSAIMPLYRLSRYRPTQPLRQRSAESTASRAGDEPAGRPATLRFHNASISEPPPDRVGGGLPNCPS